MATTTRREFTRAQLGAESTRGTIVPATAIFGGATDIQHGPMTVVVQPPKQDGSLSVATDGDVLGLGGQCRMAGYATYEDIDYLLEAGYKHVSPASDSGTPTPGQLRTYRPTLSTPDDPQTYSLEVGDSLYSFVLPYSFLTNLKLSGKIRDYCNFEAQWHSQNYVEQAFTGALTRRILERIKSQQIAFYLDGADLGTMGGTNVTDCLTAYAWDSGPLYAWANCLNRTLLPDRHVQQGQAPTATWTVLLSPTTIDLLRHYQAADKLLLRMQWLGNPIHGAGVVVAPSAAMAAAAGAAGNLTGAYLYKFVYVNQYGATTGSPAMSGAVTLTAQQANLTLITAGGATVTKRRIYRTVAGGSTYLYLATIADNTTTTFTDNIPDSQLGQAIPGANTALTGALVNKMLQIDMAARVTNWPQVGQQMDEGALSAQIQFSGAEDAGGSWAKLIEIQSRNALAALA